MNIDWRAYAVLSAVFAALTAIFGKLGVSGINPDFATLVRTIVVLAVSALLVSVRGEWSGPSPLAPKAMLFLV